MPLNGATLTAQWTPNKIHLTLDAYPWTWGTTDLFFLFDTKQYYDDEDMTHEISIIEKPVRTGYSFQDYYSEEIWERFLSYQNDHQRIELNHEAEDTYYKISSDTTLKARWNANTIHLILDAQWWTWWTTDLYFSFDTKKYYTDETLNQEIEEITKPTKNWYYFTDFYDPLLKRSFVSYKSGDERIELNHSAENTYLTFSSDTTLIARWEKMPSRMSWWLRKDHCPNGDFSDSYYDGTCEENNEHGSEEDIYEWAKEIWLTSMDSIENFQWNRFLTRAEMAKIVSIYLTKILGKKEVSNGKCEIFDDIQDIHSDLHEYIISACNLGIMGRTPDWNDVKQVFHPYYHVTKAEAVTIISRVFWGHTYKNIGDEKRYERHLHHLMDLWVVDDEKNLKDSFTRGNFYGIFRELYLMDV